MWPKSELRVFGACIAAICGAFTGLTYVLAGFVPYFALGLAGAMLLLTALRPETLTIPYEYWHRLRSWG
ncbi:MAG: hypothetical protein LCH56_14140 [Proteobacteria bacterium]|nr:hypothetical protein [Pseudomonadota bacterium]